MTSWLPLVALCVAAATAQLVSIEQETSLRPGRKYIYSYETQDLAGLSIQSNQRSGLRIKCEVILQTSDGVKVVAKIENVRLMKLNKQVRHYDPTEALPDSEWTTISGPDMHDVSDVMTQPFRFTVVTGGLDDLETSPGEPLWCVNLKRGFLSAIQLNLQGASQQSPSWGAVNNYQVWETDVTGECDTLYTVRHVTSYQQAAPLWDVTKVKDLKHCRKRPVYTYDVYNEMITTETPMSWKNFTSAELQGEYQVQGDRNRFIVRSAKVIGMQQFLKPSADKGSSVTMTLQQVRLTAVRRSQTPLLPSSARLQLSGSLLMELPKKVTSLQPKPLNEHVANSMVVMVETLLSQLITMTTPHVTENTPLLVGNITMLMIEMPTSHVETLVNKYCSGRDNSDVITVDTKKCAILLDLLPTLKKGAEILPLVQRLFSQQILTDIPASIVIGANAQFSEPTPELARQLMNIYKEVRPSGPTQQFPTICMLNAGAVIFKLQELQRNPITMETSLTTIIDNLAQEMVQMLQAETDAYRKLVIVKAMGNAGHPRCLQPLTAIIQSGSATMTLRQQAVCSLRRIAPYHKPAVMNVLMPLYLQLSAPPQLREAAFVVLMKSQPSYSVVRMLSSNLHKEKSRQVGSFVYTFLKTMSRCWIFCNPNTTMYIRRVLPGLPRFPTGPFDSRVVHSESFLVSDYFGFGDTLKLLQSPNSAVVDMLIVKLLADTLRLPMNLEMGVVASGLHGILRRARFDENADMLQTIRDVMNQIPITERSQDPWNLSFFVKFMEEEKRFGVVDEETMQAVQQYVMMNLPAWLAKMSRPVTVDTLQTVSAVEMTSTMPTPTGLVMYLNTTMVTVMGARGSLQITNQPSLADLLSLLNPRPQQDSVLPDMMLTVDMTPSMASYLDYGVGVTIGPYGAGRKYDTRLYTKYPLHFRVKLNPVTGKLKVKAVQDNQDKTVMKLTYDPVTYTCKRPTPASLHWFIDELPERLPIIHPVTDTKTFSVPMLDKVFLIEYTYPTFTSATPLTRVIVGRKCVVIRERTSSDAPRELEIQALYVSPEAERPQSVISQMLQDSETERQPRYQQEQRQRGWFFGNPVQQPRTYTNELPIQFEQVQIDPRIQNPIKRQLILAMRTVGAPVEKKVQLQLTHVYSEDLQIHQDNVQVILKPTPQEPTKKLKLDIRTDLKAVKKYMKKEEMNIEKMISEIEMHYGEKQYPLNVVDIQMKLKPCQQSQMWEQQQWQLQQKPVTLQWDIEYRQVPEMVRKIGETCRMALKMIPEVVPTAKLYVNKNLQNAPNRVTIVTKINTFEGKMNVGVISPRELDNVTNIPVPFINDNKYSLVSNKQYHFIHQEISKHGKCELMGEQLRTFDRKRILLPKTNCEVKLAKDCSSSSYPKFMVTAKKLDKDDDKKIIYMYLPEHKIKIEPEQRWFSTEIKVEVNGRQLSLPSDGQPVIIRKHNSFSGEKLVEIKKQMGRVEVYCSMTGLKVKTDCKDIKIKADSGFRSQLCGLCADYNGEFHDDLTGPLLEEFRRPAAFLLSYVLNPSSCNAQQLREQLQQPTGECLARPHTAVVEREEDARRRVTCFSVRPVTRCPFHCRKLGERRPLIGFYCLPAGDSATQRLLQQVQAGQQVQELRDMPVHIYEYVNTQDSCSPAA